MYCYKTYYEFHYCYFGKINSVFIYRKCNRASELKMLILERKRYAKSKKELAAKMQKLVEWTLKSISTDKGLQRLFWVEVGMWTIQGLITNRKKKIVYKKAAGIS